MGASGSLMIASLLHLFTLLSEECMVDPLITVLSEVIQNIAAISYVGLPFF